MKRGLFTVIAVLLGLVGNAQEPGSKLDLRIGLGTSFLGTGDMRTVMLENEVNMKLNTYFSVSGGMGLAKSYSGVFDQTSFVQLNANVYVSPFQNNKRNDFRIGTGLSWYAVSDTYALIDYAYYGDVEVTTYEYVFDKRNAFGLNLILENTYAITDRYFVGVKAFVQPFQNADRNTGALLRFGVAL